MELVQLIRAEGPIPISRYMDLCLDHPSHGYYRTASPFGGAGDFTTAPEISQMFGEIIALFLAQAWLDQGRPRPVRLVELGPGRGTLMADLLRVLDARPDLAGALDVHLVERSPRLRTVQHERLGDRATWHERLDEVPAGPMLLVANEFLDALPVDQLVWRSGGWGERRVGLEAGRLAFVEVPRERDAVVPSPPAVEEGAITELSAPRQALVALIAQRIAACGGLALLIDYGASTNGPTGDTLQAVRAHRAADPLADPGDADLSAQVEFGALVETAGAAGAAPYGPVYQGTFLRTLGIETRALQLMKHADAAARHRVRSALHRLTDPAAMGEVFKVLIIAPAEAPPPPGFARHD